MSLQQPRPLTIITPAQVAANNRKYREKFPNWTMSLNQCPMFSYRQMEYDHQVCKSGYLKCRRPGVVATAKALKGVLTYSNVERLINANRLSPELAREWGAIMQYGRQEVPFNLIYRGLNGRNENPDEPPTPNTDRLVVLGLLFPTEEALMHFKHWYEDAGEGFDFEKDLILPMLTYWEWYRADYPEVRAIDFGKGSVSQGTPASLEVPWGRKAGEPEVYEEYPNVSINEVTEADDAAEGVAETEEDRPVGRLPSGAMIF